MVSLPVNGVLRFIKSEISSMKKLNGILMIVVLLCLNSCKKDEEESKQANIDFTYTKSSTLPVTVTFTAQPSDEGSVVWDFGDGQTATGVTVTHVYDSIGIYAVSSTLQTSYGSAGKNKFVNASFYNRLRVYRVNGTASLTKPDGSPWDTDGTNPDLYMRIYDAGGNELQPGGYTFFDNATTIHYPYNPAVDFTDFIQSGFRIKFMDYDPVATTDDLIGSYSFLPTDYFSRPTQFPLSMTATDNTTGVSITVDVLWAN